MASFKCKQCGNEQEAVRGMPPTSCKKCKAKGAIWMKVAAGGHSPATKAPPITPPKATGSATMPAPKSTGGIPAPAMPAVTKPAIAPRPLVPAMKSFTPTPLPAPPVVKQVPPVIAQPTPIPPPVKEQTPPLAPSAPGSSPPSLTPVTKVAPVIQRSSARVAWTFPEPIQSGAKPQRNCPAVDHAGRVYFAIGNKVFAFDNNRGDLTKVWNYETGGRILGSPVVGSDGNARVHSEDGHLHIVSKDGKRVGTPVQVGEPLGWATPLVDSQNTTWICGYHGGLSKVEAIGTAASALYFRGKQRFDCTGLIHDGVFYVGAENSCVYAIPLGESRGQNVWDHLNEEGRTGWFINSSLALASGPTLVVASRDDRLYGFQLDGKKRWSIELNGQVLGSPIVDADDSIYVGLSVSEGREKPRGALVRIDGMSHKVRWRYETDSPVESTPVLGDDGTVYFGENDGFIHAVNGDGKQVWTEQVADGVRSSGTILAGGRVIFGLENGQFVALKCESQSLRAGAWVKFLGNASQTGTVS